MMRRDLSKFLFYTALIIILLGLSFGFGMYSGIMKTGVYRMVRNLTNSVNLVFSEFSTLTKSKPTHFLQPARYEGSGVTVNDLSDDSEELILLSGFFEDTNELRLIQRDGTIVARWPVKFYDIFPDPSHLMKPPATNWNIDLHGALILPDGAVVFNFEYAGLVKLDRCGRVVWTLAQRTHHSVERAESGGYWVPGRRRVTNRESPYPPFETPLREDTIVRVSEDGTVLSETSVPMIFYENQLEAILTATGSWFTTGMEWDKEIVHVNKVGELTTALAKDFPMFEAGDLVLSIRESNLLMVVDPDTNKVKWWRIGPWIRQHDPEFIPGGKLIVFNNNIYRDALKRSKNKSRNTVPRLSNILEFDLASDAYRVVYGGKGEEMLSILRGKNQWTQTGGLLVTEPEGGRVFETNAEGRIIWEYINRYSPEQIAEVSEARVYPVSYFSVSDWSCGQ